MAERKDEMASRQARTVGAASAPRMSSRTAAEVGCGDLRRGKVRRLNILPESGALPAVPSLPRQPRP